MRDAFKTVTQAVGEIVGGIYTPLSARSKMWPLILWNSIGCNVPHLGVGILNILLQAEPGTLWRILAIPHAAEFLEVSLDVLVCMRTTISWASTFLPAALQLRLRFVAMAHICILLFD